MKSETFYDIFKRYAVATLGLVLVAVGVACSIHSNLGTAPISCPPYVLNLWNSSISVGQFTMLMHGIFILLQVLLLRKDFKLEHLMQIPAAILFGLLTDTAIWAFQWIEAPTYMSKMILCLVSILVTALGISLEVIGGAWMLAGEMTTLAISVVIKKKFPDVKIGFDVFLTISAAAFAWLVFGNPSGNGNEVVIREGTILQAVLTGLAMRLTDPMAKAMFGEKRCVNPAKKG